MQTILPDASTTFLAALVIPLVLGILIGIILKEAIKVGLALVILVLVLIAVGIVQPHQVIEPIVSLFRSGPALASKVDQIAGYLPYSSLTFILGLAIGFLRG